MIPVMYDLLQGRVSITEREAWLALSIVPVVGDVWDRERMLAVFREHRPQVVAHAAAYKHVPLMETNAPEAVKNNVFGTQTLGEVAGEWGPRR